MTVSTIQRQLLLLQQKTTDIECPCQQFNDSYCYQSRKLLAMNDCVNNSTAAIVITAENYFSYQTNHKILFHFVSIYSQVHIGHQLYRIFQMFGQLNAAHLSMLDLGCYVKIKKMYSILVRKTRLKIQNQKLEVASRKRTDKLLKSQQNNRQLMIYNTFCSFYFGHYVVCPSLYDLINQTQESLVRIKLGIVLKH